MIYLIAQGMQSLSSKGEQAALNSTSEGALGLQIEAEVYKLI